MERPSEGIDPKTYHVRFEDGPRGATETVVLGLDSGAPPELLLTPGRPEGIYVRAGGPRADGSLPYLWMPGTKVSALRRLGPRRPDRRTRNST